MDFFDKVKEQELQRSASPSASIAGRFSGTREKCFKCGKVVYANEKVLIGGDIYHTTCLRCEVCNCVLKFGAMAALEGLYYCKVHFREKFKQKGSYDFVKTAPSSRPTVTPSTVSTSEEVAGGLTGSKTPSPRQGSPRQGSPRHETNEELANEKYPSPAAGASSPAAPAPLAGESKLAHIRKQFQQLSQKQAAPRPAVETSSGTASAGTKKIPTVFAALRKWDQHQSHSSLQFTNSNLTVKGPTPVGKVSVTSSTPAQTLARSNLPYTKGVNYFEVTNEKDGAYLFVGIVEKNMSSSKHLSEVGWCVGSNGEVWSKGAKLTAGKSSSSLVEEGAKHSSEASPEEPAAQDDSPSAQTSAEEMTAAQTAASSNSVSIPSFTGKMEKIGVLVDMDKRTVSFHIKGAWHKNLFTEIPERVYPSVSVNTGTCTTAFDSVQHPPL